MSKITRSMLTTIFFNIFIDNIKKYTTSNKPRKDECSPGIVKSCKTICKLYEIFLLNPTSLHKQSYVVFRNTLIQIIRIVKRLYL